MSSESLGGKPKLNIDGLFLEWENERPIRDHLNHQGAVLFTEHITENVKTACYDHIHSVLVPLLKKMAATSGAPQPTVEPLREHIADLYKRMSKQVGEQQVVHDSWMIRNFLAFVKMKVRIRKPSTVLGHISCDVFEPLITTAKYTVVGITLERIYAIQSCAKVPRFQELCLILDPGLQDGC